MWKRLRRQQEPTVADGLAHLEAARHILERADRYANAAACDYCEPRICADCGHLESCANIHNRVREQRGEVGGVNPADLWP